MAQSRPTPDAVAVPKALEPLVQQLARLHPDERDLVVRAAATRRRHKSVSWQLFEAARGVVSFGGDAVEDSKALYDG